MAYENADFQQGPMPDSFQAEAVELSEHERAKVSVRQHPEDPTDDNDRRVLQFWMERARASYEHYREERNKTEEAIAYYQSRFACGIRPDNTGVDRFTTFPDDTYNLNYPIRHIALFPQLIDAIAARVLADRPVVTIVAGKGGNAADNATTAAIGNTELSHIDNFNQWETQTQQHVKQCVLAGMSWTKTWFDKSVMGRAKGDGGQVVRHQTGEVLKAVADPREVFMEPCMDERHMQWLLHIYERPLGWVKANCVNGKFVRPVGDDRAYELLTQLRRGVPARPSDNNDHDSTPVPVIEAYQYSQDPKTGIEGIWRAVWASQTRIYKPEPLPTRALRPTYYNRSLHSAWGTTNAWDAIVIQREMNKKYSGFAHIVDKNQFVQIQCPPGMTEEEMDKIGTSVGPIRGTLDDNGKLVDIKFITPPPLDSQGHIMAIEADKNHMRDIMGIHEISSGVDSTEARSGKHAQVIQQQDNANLQRFVSNYLRGEEVSAMDSLLLADEYWESGKVLEVVGKDKRHQVEIFEGGLIDNIAAVRITQKSRIPLEPQALIELAMTLFQGQAFLPENKPQLAAMLKFLNYENPIEDEKDEVAQARAKASVENRMLDQGIMVPCDVDERHDIHIVVHLERINEPDFETLPPPAQLAHKTHLNMQRATQAEVESQMAQQMLAGQAALMPPGAAEQEQAPQKNGSNGATSRTAAPPRR